MTETHPAFQDNLPAYALGALDPEEVAALEAHLQTCGTCRTELADYQRASEGFLAGLPPQLPPAGVRRTLQKRLAVAAKRARPRPAWSFNKMAATGAIVLLLGLNIFSAIQVYSLKQEQAELSSSYDSQQTAIAMLAYPSTQSVPFSQGEISGSLLVDKKRDLLAIFAWHLPPPPPGKTYQVWLIDPQEDRTSGGFLSPELHQPFVMDVIWTRQPLAGYVGLGITIEPIGGSTKPTGERILRVDF